jgi:hypothetical protein
MPTLPGPPERAPSRAGRSILSSVVRHERLTSRGSVGSIVTEAAGGASGSKMPPCQERSGQTIQQLCVESFVLERQALDAVAEAELDDIP